MLLSVDLDTSRAKGQEAVGVFAEVEDHLLGVEGAMLGFVDLFAHRNSSCD